MKVLPMMMVSSFCTLSRGFVVWPSCSGGPAAAFRTRQFASSDSSRLFMAAGEGDEDKVLNKYSRYVNVRSSIPFSLLVCVCLTEELRRISTTNFSQRDFLVFFFSIFSFSSAHFITTK